MGQSDGGRSRGPGRQLSVKEKMGFCVNVGV
uniref:Uncharacterized protein n=1 Tax=Xenopus laevis TaxID=8355 RepID=Q91789_XENLA|nr:ORF [Xenopus laevis]